MDRTAPSFFVRCLPDGVGGPAPRIENISARITSLRYEDDERKADKLTLTIDNFDLALFDDPAFKRGMPLEVSWGYPGAMAPPRLCIVQRITGSLTLQVEALARSILLNQVTRARVFTNMRRSDIVRQIAREAGYGNDAIDIEDTEVVHDAISQGGRTDAQLLMRFARQEGFEFYVDQDGFHFHRRRLGQAPTRIFTYYTDRRGEVLSLNVENDVTAKPGRVRARGRDPLTGEEIDVSADDGSDSERETLSPIRLIVDPETRQTRIEASVGSEETRPTSATTAADAARQVRGRFRRVQLTAVKMRLEVVGDPLLLAKTVIELRGVGTRLSGRYYVKKVEHAIGSGYRCTLDIVSDGDGGHSTESRVARGLELVAPGVPTSGRPNTAEPQPGAEDGNVEEGAPLEAHTIVDPETRQTRIEYRDSRRSRTGLGS